MKNFINTLSVLLMLFIFSSCMNQNNNEDGDDFVLNIPDEYTSVVETAEITVNGVQTQLEGERLRVGDTIQDISLDMRADYFNEVDTTKLGDYEGYRLIQTVPSLDTPVCSIQTKQLEAASKMFNDTTFFIISNDTPFALQRFCSDNSIDNLLVLSDARTREFGKNNGLFLPEYSLLTRSVFIIDENNKIVYVDYAEEVTNHLDLLNALSFLKILKNNQ